MSPEGLTPADGATAATLYLNGPVTLNVAADAEGALWVCTVDEAETANLQPGTYQGALRVTTASAGPLTVPCGAVTVLENVATAPADAYLTHEERMIPLLERALEKRVKIDMAAYTITNTSATREQLKDMRDLLKSCKATVALRRRGGRLASTAVVFRRAG